MDDLIIISNLNDFIFVRLPYISINYMEARTQLCISQKLSLMEPRHMKNRQWDIFNTKKYTNFK